MENIITTFDQVFLFNAYPAEILKIETIGSSVFCIYKFLELRAIKSNRMPVNEYTVRLYYMRGGDLTGPGSSRVQGVTCRIIIIIAIAM